MEITEDIRRLYGLPITKDIVYYPDKHKPIRNIVCNCHYNRMCMLCYRSNKGVNKMAKSEQSEEFYMLKGNINRMMLTDDKEELYEQYCWAKARLETIYRENSKRIKE